MNARTFLIATLRDGDKHPDEIRAELAFADFYVSWRSIERAKHDLGIISVREGFPAKLLAWRLPRHLRKMTYEEELAFQEELVTSLSSRLSAARKRLRELRKGRRGIADGSSDQN